MKITRRIIVTVLLVCILGIELIGRSIFAYGSEVTEVKVKGEDGIEYTVKNVQYSSYEKMIVTGNNKRVIIRTYDDKVVSEKYYKVKGQYILSETDTTYISDVEKLILQDEKDYNGDTDGELNESSDSDDILYGKSSSIKWGKKYFTPIIFGKRYWYVSGSKSGKMYKKVGHNGESNNIPYYKLDGAKQTTCYEYINGIKQCRKNWVKAIGTGVTTYFASVLLVKISALAGLLGHGAAAIAGIITTVTTMYTGYKETISYITEGYCGYCEVQDLYVNVSSL